MTSPPSGPARDRDVAGRARNQRPRDELGRPLPYGEAGVERAPEGVVRTPAQTIALAGELLAAGKPFHAHEVFEDAWKSASDEADRGLWKALAQLAVGLTHEARGNLRGRAALLERAVDALAPYAGQRSHGLDIDAIRRWIRARLAGDDPEPRTPPPITPWRTGLKRAERA